MRSLPIRLFQPFALLLMGACGSSEGEQRRAEGFVPTASPSDEQPWASAFLNSTMGEAGKPGPGSASALSWLNWGVPLTEPLYGSIAVLDYGGGQGHVGLVVGTYDGMIVLLGGDQDNSVNKTAFAPEEIKAYRWPADTPLDPRGLPEVLPTELENAGASRPAAPASRARKQPAGTVAPGSARYGTPDDRQVLQVESRAADRIRFTLRADSCGRRISGTAYHIYPGDAQIDADAGVGYPAREYFYWADKNGKAGVAIRLSIREPNRAKVREWGPRSECPFTDGLMRGDAPIRAR
jgi:uncharacterized protein (TIGR02594 family)